MEEVKELRSLCLFTWTEIGHFLLSLYWTICMASIAWVLWRVRKIDSRFSEVILRAFFVIWNSTMVPYSRFSFICKNAKYFKKNIQLIFSSIIFIITDRPSPMLTSLKRSLGSTSFLLTTKRKSNAFYFF